MVLWGPEAAALASPLLGRLAMIRTADSVEAAASEHLAAEVDRRLRIGLALTVAGVVAISLATASGFWQALGIGLFYLLLPSLAVAQLPLLRVHEIERSPMYVGSAATILIIGAVALGFGLPASGLSGLALSWIPRWEMVAWVGGATITGLAIIGVSGPAEGRSAVQSTGEYHDEVVWMDGLPKFKQRRVIPDTFNTDKIVAVPL